MAKVGEGDPRWIVSERADGTNVAGWHWTESDSLPFCKHRLNELFASSVFLNDNSGACLQWCGMKKVTGEAFVNTRKGKKIFLYELCLEIEFKGTNGAGVDVSGVVEVPYFSVENEGDSVDIKVVLNNNSTLSGPMEIFRQTIYSVAKPIITKTLNEFVAECRGNSNNYEKKESSSAVEQPQSPAATSSKSEANTVTKTFTKTYDLGCSPQDIYSLFLDSSRVMAFCQSQVQVNPVVGGSFIWFDGSIRGEFIELQLSSLIKLKWQFSSWRNDVWSTVEMRFKSDRRGLTKVDLIHSGIPAADESRFNESFWTERIFGRIIQIFGYAP